MENSELEFQDEFLAEYSETLHTSSRAKRRTAGRTYKMWRNVEAIEKKVDKLHITRAKRPSTEVERSVDKIIKKDK